MIVNHGVDHCGFLDGCGKACETHAFTIYKRDARSYFIIFFFVNKTGKKKEKFDLLIGDA